MTPCKVKSPSLKVCTVANWDVEVLDEKKLHALGSYMYIGPLLMKLKGVLANLATVHGSTVQALTLQGDMNPLYIHVPYSSWVYPLVWYPHDPSVSSQSQCFTDSTCSCSWVSG